MRRACSLLVALLALVSGPGNSEAQPQPLPLEKVESHIDDHGCLQFEATARVDVPLDDLFDALSRPERLYAYIPSATLLDVFVSAPQDLRFWDRMDTWTTNRRQMKVWAEILEWDGLPGWASPPGGLPTKWVKYRFDRIRHTIEQQDIGSTLPWGFTNPHSKAKYVLSSPGDGSATSVYYTSSQCSPSEDRKKLANLMRGRTESQERFLGEWLKVAVDQAHLGNGEALKAPTPPAKGYPLPLLPPGVPTATGSPVRGFPGAVP